MVSVNLKSLVGKLNPTTQRTLEGAAGLCLSRTNYNVELEHWLYKLVEEPDTDLTIIFKQFDVNPARVLQELTSSMDRFKTGNARPPALSPDLITAIREAWILGSVEYGSSLVRTGYLLAAILADETLGRTVAGASSELKQITAPQLLSQLAVLLPESREAGGEAISSKTASPSSGGQPVKPGGVSKTPSLDQFTVDMTERARQGEIDPVLGRDEEISQVVDILTRRRQNNPIIVGEPGVGKTAAVEGFALRIAAGDVPEPLKNVSLRSLDLALLQAGAGVKGEFENRLKTVLNEVKASPQPIIMFIDEAHTMIGAGGSAGQGDAANLLKPALARGELRTIAATTWAEYKKYFEKDAALARRFQVVQVGEPPEKSAIEMIRGIVDVLEKHHHVRILDEAVRDAVVLSKRYISGRHLPDKAVSLIDTACARVAMSYQATPGQVTDLHRREEQLNVAIKILEREAAAGGDHTEEIEELIAEKEAVTADLQAIEERWKSELELVQQIRDAREQLMNGSSEGEEKEADSKPVALDSLKALNEKLEAIQGDAPLVHVCVDSQAIAEVVSNWTGIPVGRMVSDEISNILHLKDRMEGRVVGQSHGLSAIAKSVQTSRAKLKDPQRPIGVFMLAGPSGVGKTETAITLAELLYGGEQNMTTINMSEFKEEHKVSLLMGSPPGYVGYGEGGILTEAVRRRPYSVVLLDELEKAHEGVQEIFYQVFDKGILRDGEGRDIDFKNTVIIMTSNAGTDLITKLCEDPDTMPNAEGLREALHQELLKTFKPAFLGRCTLIPYFPLSEDVLRDIIHLKLKKVVNRVHDNHRATLEYTPAVVDSILSRCQEVASGARNVDNILNGTMLPELSTEFLSALASGKTITTAKIDVAEDDQFSYDIK